VTLLCLFTAIFAQSPFIDPNYVSVLDSVECNRLFPFTFSTKQTNL